MSELVRHQDTTPQLSMQDQMKFAEIVTKGDMVPKAYVGKPANALIAIGLGQAMGLSPAESLYRIDVIQGKPTASAELIASNIRKAGHTLRVEIDESNMRVTATVYRADDPEFPHTVVRDIGWAKDMGLTSKDNYKKQPITMLQWRAISGVGRLACPEALYGVTHTPDELGEGGPVSRPRRTPHPVVLEEGTEGATEPMITEEQWGELVAAAETVGKSPADVGAAAAELVGHQLSGWQEIPTEEYPAIMALITTGETK